MARPPVRARRRATAAPEPSPIAPNPAPIAPESKPDPLGRRLALNLDADGRIVLDSMRGTTVETLRGALRDPSLLDRLGMTPPKTDAASAGPGVPPIVTHALANMIGTLDAIVIARVVRATPDVIEQVAPLTASEVALIVPPLQAVLDKYGSSWLEKYGAELSLAVALVSVTTAKIAAARSLMAAKHQPATVVRHPSSPPEASPLPAEVAAPPATPTTES